MRVGGRGLNLSDFHIGSEFWCSGRRWRCTDLGSRVVVAIRVDEATIVTLRDGDRSERTIGGEEAQAIGWFNGPPYGVAEIVFDEYDLEACSVEPDQG